MITPQEARGFTDVLKVYSELKPLLDSPEKMATMISGVENAYETIKKGTEVSAQLEELRIAQGKHAEAAATISRAKQIIAQSQQLLDESMQQVRGEREALDKDKKDHEAQVLSNALFHQSISDREEKVSAREKSLSEESEAVSKQKEDYANKISLLNKLNGGQ